METSFGAKIASNKSSTSKLGLNTSPAPAEISPENIAGINGDFRRAARRNQISVNSHSTSQKPYAYSTLVRLQEQATTDPDLIQSLAHSSRSLISLILIDISSEDEEIAAQALKCLGFMIYHPSVASVISASDACMIVELLEKVITTTHLKSVCNLGVWCISIQQLDASFLAEKFHSLLRAIIHALDNPIGSLSTTFEAMQAVVKLTSQLGDTMRGMQIYGPLQYIEDYSALIKGRKIWHKDVY